MVHRSGQQMVMQEKLAEAMRIDPDGLRHLAAGRALDQLRSDTYYEFGDFAEGGFRVTSSEKEGKIAILEMEKIGTVKDTETNDRNPVRVTKDIYMEDNELELRIRINCDD